MLGKGWYIAGGGDNRSGCRDVLCLHIDDAAEEAASLPGLRWEVVVGMDVATSIVSEGMGMVGLEQEHLLLAFGGYNGRHQNSLSIFKKGELAHPMVVETKHWQRKRFIQFVCSLILLISIVLTKSITA